MFVSENIAKPNSLSRTTLRGENEKVFLFDI